ncbi:uncharacterized protein At3g50808-like isoform X2 [Actinidia eriantha]|uniref:uncharacterized protein At3g50808-like isoform X2 n=1 Tax=Actinidia eriantha TaxID=165200 RepID=UPI0025902C3E|nr:uncharacterized protein At3g50808-like isoform X2 [Actinidia eriantha]
MEVIKPCNPQWLTPLLESEFRCSCESVYKLHFCVVCMTIAFCENCKEKDQLHEAHQSIQIFVASRARAVRVENISRLLDISNIHQFKVNDKSILYLNSRSKQEPREIRDNTFKKCKMCQWPIDTQLFCSIGCKVKSNMPFVTDNYEHTHLFKKSNKKDNTPNSSKKETVKNSRKGIPKRSPFF